MRKTSHQEPAFMGIKDQLDRIETMIEDLAKDIREQRNLVTSLTAAMRRIELYNSPASLSVDEKARLIIEARRRGKAALKETLKMINGE